ncbi:MAG: hypothetical protein ABIG90_03315 [bacterium]
MQKGIALISVLIITSFLSFLGIGFALIMVTDSKIATYQELALQTHYLAEAGTQYAIWQLNNDWKDDFENGDLEKDLKLTNELYDGDEIKIKAVSIGHGNAEIESQANYKDAKRKVIIEVFKPLGGITEPLETRAILANKDIAFNKAQNVKINQGSIHANNKLDLKKSSIVSVDQTASALVISVDRTSNLDAEILPEADSLSVPALDFEQYKEKADAIMSQEEFQEYLALHDPAVLNGIIYVNGTNCRIDIERNQSLTINGFLLTDCSLHIADQGGFGYTDLIIRNTLGQPSGIASKNSIIVKQWASLDIQGLIYALKSIECYGEIFSSIDVIGGIISASPNNDLYIYAQPNELTITYDKNIIKTALGQAQDSPIITLERWEEEY